MFYVAISDTVHILIKLENMNDGSGFLIEKQQAGYFKLNS